MQEVEQLEKNNQKLKQQIMQFRLLNMSNIQQFKIAHLKLEQTAIQSYNKKLKYSAKQKTFLGEQLKISRMLSNDHLSQAIRQSGVIHDGSRAQVMTQSIPLIKHRVSMLIHKNREKLRISQQYRKFGESLQNMFVIMKQYKGRDDIEYISNEFVQKQQKIKQLLQYIGLLQQKITLYQKDLEKKNINIIQLSQELNQKKIYQTDQNYININNKIIQDIQLLKNQEKSRILWFQKINLILLPILDEPINRSNAISTIGKIETKLNISVQNQDKKQLKFQTISMPNFDISQHNRSNLNTDLLNYQKMKEIANQFVKSKVN